MWSVERFAVVVGNLAKLSIFPPEATDVDESSNLTILLRLEGSGTTLETYIQVTFQKDGSDHGSVPICLIEVSESW
jgi:hypothetical protein